LPVSISLSSAGDMPACLAGHQAPGQRGRNALDPGIVDHDEPERKCIALRLRPFQPGEKLRRIIHRQTSRRCQMR
jgi:hypothetical protein